MLHVLLCTCMQVETCKDESLKKRVIGYYKYLVSFHVWGYVMHT